MITIDDVFKFLKTSLVTYDLLQAIHPRTSQKINPKIFILENYWEKRFNFDVLYKLWENKFTFIVYSSFVSPEVTDLVLDIEKKYNCQAQSHIYFGKLGSKSFPKHSDLPDNLIFQIVGKSKFILYNEFHEETGPCPNKNTTIKHTKILNPGDSVFIPSKQIHYFEPITDRLSISVPMIRS